MIVDWRRYSFGTVGFTLNVMIVHDGTSLVLSVTLCTDSRVTPRYQSFGSGFAAGALLVRTDAPGRMPSSRTKIQKTRHHCRIDLSLQRQSAIELEHRLHP